MALALALLVAAALPGVAWGDLVLSISDPPALAIAGDRPQLTITVENTGDTVVPDVNPYVDTNAPMEGCDFGGFPVCVIGDMPPHHIERRTVTLGPLLPGPTTVSVRQLNAVGSPAEWSLDVQRKARLEFDLSAAPTAFTEGNATTLKAVVRNQGSGPATGATVRFTLPAGLEPAALPTGCSTAGLTVTCDLGPIPSFGSETREVPLHPPPVGSWTVLAAAGWARDNAVPADVALSVLSPNDDTGSSGLPIDPNALTPATPQTVTLERITRGLPGRNRCVRDRVLDVLLRSPGGVDPKTAVVRIGKKVVRRLKGSRATAPFTVRVPRSGRFVVRVSVTLTDGRILMGSRTYRVCRRR